ncbi:MAG: hypothetical protein KBT47_06365 [Armatimonadetes bacterium]|nr:hypothetical protein [Candidatus Hippobium faecium]
MKISYRVSTTTWESDYHFDNLMILLKKYKDYIDEIALFTGFVHTCLPIERVEKMALIAKDRIKRIKALGISCGINHLCTVGHINENKAHSLDFENYDCQTDIKGIKSNVLCFSSEKTYYYSERVYTALAEAEPDFIWVDDDFRVYGHSEGVFCCFCPLCMKKFGEIVNVPDLTREKFIEITHGRAENSMFYRKKWLEFNKNQMLDLLGFIRETIDKRNPNIIMGMMSATHAYADDCMPEITDIMSRNGELPAKWRPGGGFYQDFNKRGLLEKAACIGMQTVLYLDKTEDIQSEIENFPYNHLHKSAKMNVLETSAYIGAGCSGVAYNVLFPDNETSVYNSAPETECRFGKILPYRSFFTALDKAFGKAHNRGVFVFGTNKTSQLSQKLNSEWPEPDNSVNPLEYFENGIPRAYKNTGTVMLMNDNFRALEKEEILKMLSGGVILSGEALNALNEMGYGEYVGFRTGDIISDDGIEKFTDHPLNGDGAFVWRDCRQSFKGWAVPCFGLVKCDEKAQCLASLVDYADIQYKDKDNNPLYTMGIYENSLGGRICVMTYFPCSYLQSGVKSVQMKNILKYVSRNSVSFVSSYHNILMFDRSGENPAILLINNSFDQAENVIVNIAEDIECLKITDSDMSERKVSRLKYADGYSVFDIGNMDAFSMCLLSK